MKGSKMLGIGKTIKIDQFGDKLFLVQGYSLVRETVNDKIHGTLNILEIDNPAFYEEQIIVPAHANCRCVPIELEPQRRFKILCDIAIANKLHRESRPLYRLKRWLCSLRWVNNWRWRRANKKAYDTTAWYRMVG